MPEPKVLVADLETAPATALVFGQRQQDISNIQIVKHDRVIGVGAKWHGAPSVMWRSEYHHGKDVMVNWVRDLIDQADIVVHFNGTTFDMPWIYREIAMAGLPIPSPVLEVDLLKTIRRKFRFMSNKLENVVRMFGLDAKMQTGGFKLWRDIEVGTPEEQEKAWRTMRRYCKNDVLIEEQLYDFLKGWIVNHPNVALFTEEDGCRNCPAGADQRVYEGYTYTSEGKFRRFHCRECGKWDRSRRRVVGTADLQVVAS